MITILAPLYLPPAVAGTADAKRTRRKRTARGQAAAGFHRARARPMDRLG
jgi:hypothetical protein